MRKFLETLWFQPYTPIIIIALIVWMAAKFIYPPIQRYIQSKNPVFDQTTITITPTPIPSLATEESILAAVGKLIVLPTDETPQLLTLTPADIERFKGQPFFKNAKAGDIFIIYNKNKKAYLFDPVNNRIIDTAPITAAEPTPQATSSAMPSESTPSATPTLTQTHTPTP